MESAIEEVPCGGAIGELPAESRAWFTAEEGVGYALRAAAADVPAGEAEPEPDTAVESDDESAIVASLGALFRVTESDGPVDGLPTLVRQLRSLRLTHELDWTGPTRRFLHAARREVATAPGLTGVSRLFALADHWLREMLGDHAAVLEEPEHTLAAVNVGTAVHRMVGRRLRLESGFWVLCELSASGRLSAGEASRAAHVHLLRADLEDSEALRARRSLGFRPAEAFAVLASSASEPSAWVEFLVGCDDNPALWLELAAETLAQRDEVAAAAAVVAGAGDVPGVSLSLLELIVGRSDAATERVFRVAGAPAAGHRAAWLERAKTLDTAQQAITAGDARGALATVRRLEPEPEVLAIRARANEALGKHGRAMELWVQVLDTDPEAREALAGLGRTRVATGEHGSGVELLERAFQAGWDRWGDARLLVVGYLELGRVADAERWLELAADRGVAVVEVESLIAERALVEARHAGDAGRAGEAGSLFDVAARYASDRTEVWLERWRARVAWDGAESAADWLSGLADGTLAPVVRALATGESGHPEARLAELILGRDRHASWTYLLAVRAGIDTGRIDDALSAAEAGIASVRGDVAAAVAVEVWSWSSPAREDAAQLYALASSAHEARRDLDAAIHALGRGLAHIGAAPILVEGAGRHLAGAEGRALASWERGMASTIGPDGLERLIAILRDRSALARGGSEVGEAARVEVPAPPSRAPLALSIWLDSAAIGLLAREEQATEGSGTELREMVGGGRIPLQAMVPRAPDRSVWDVRTIRKASDGFREIE